MLADEDGESGTEVTAATSRVEPVPVTIPPWMMGGVPSRLRDFAGWDLSTVDDGHRVRAIEHDGTSHPGLIKVARVGRANDPGDASAYWRLKQLQVNDHFMPADAFQRALAEHINRQNRYENEFPMLAAGIKSLLFAQNDSLELPDTAAQIMGDWLKTNIGFTDASMHLVTTAPQLQNRYGVTRSLLQPEVTPPTDGSEGPAFSSQLHFLQDINVGLGAYIEPLLTSLSPNVWGVTAPRIAAVIIVCWGKLLVGHRDLTADLLTLPVTPGYPAPLHLDPIPSPRAYREALKWWISQLQLVFSELTEPANTVDETGFYSPAAALERMVTFEQLLRSAQVVATSVDPHARVLALFNVLDSVGGLIRGVNFSTLTNLQSARRILATVTDAIPPDAQPVLLPRATAAVAALEEAQRGFFVDARLRGTDILLPDAKTGVDDPVPLMKATEFWIRILRNSQHGYDRTPDARERAILTAHTGEIPERLPDLAWLAVLSILAQPRLLRRDPRQPAKRQRRRR